MKSVFTVLAVLLVTGLSGCASVPVPVPVPAPAPFDHLHNGFVVGKTTCSEIAEKAGQPITEMTHALIDGVVYKSGATLIYRTKGQYSGFTNQFYYCDNNGVLINKTR
jgi:hypothetical protein